MKVNGERATPGTRVSCGDRIDLVRDRLPYGLHVVEIPSRRGPAEAARRCYREDEEIVRLRDIQSAALRQDRMLMPKTEGRPDKHTRRLLRARSGK